MSKRRPYSVKSDSALQRAINRFARAVDEKAFQGEIPYGESEAASLAYEAIDVELKLARAALEALIERRLA